MYDEGSDSDTDSSDSSVIIVERQYGYGDSDNDSDSDTASLDESDHELIVPLPVFNMIEDNGEDDEIYQEDSVHLYSEKLEGHYYIGLAKRLRSDSLLLVNSVSPTTFFRYPFHQIRNYLIKYSILEVYQAKVHIMKLCITDDEIFTVVLKTHWLRLIQRHWKKVYSEKKQIMRCRCNLRSLHTRELCGKFPVGLRNLPGLGGMLECYSKTNKLSI
jgi:hypothetical protein